jgi:thiosulfate/3-mercaptopyruvate sulfurtransferase
MAERNTTKFGPLFDAAWLADNLDRPNLRTVDATWYLPIETKDARVEFAEVHIPGAVFVDISDLCETDHAAPHMLPSPERFAVSVGALGIGDDYRVVIYDKGEYAATRSCSCATDRDRRRRDSTNRDGQAAPGAG